MKDFKVIEVKRSIFEDNNADADKLRAEAYVKGEVKDAEDALKGARDIIAEQVSEDEQARSPCSKTR